MTTTTTDWTKLTESEVQRTYAEGFIVEEWRKVALDWYRELLRLLRERAAYNTLDERAIHEVAADAAGVWDYEIGLNYLALNGRDIERVRYPDKNAPTAWAWNRCPGNSYGFEVLRQQWLGLYTIAHQVITGLVNDYNLEG